MGELQLALAQPGEEDRGDDQDVEEAADHAADDRRGQGPHDFRAGAGAPHDRQQAGHGGGDGHDLGPQPQLRALLDRLDQVRVVERRAALARVSSAAASSR